MVSTLTNHNLGIKSKSKRWCAQCAVNTYYYSHSLTGHFFSESSCRHSLKRQHHWHQNHLAPYSLRHCDFDILNARFAVAVDTSVEGEGDTHRRRNVYSIFLQLQTTVMAGNEQTHTPPTMMMPRNEMFGTRAEECWAKQGWISWWASWVRGWGWGRLSAKTKNATLNAECNLCARTRIFRHECEARASKIEREWDKSYSEAVRVCRYSNKC